MNEVTQLKKVTCNSCTKVELPIVSLAALCREQ